LGNGLPTDGLKQLVEEMKGLVAQARQYESPRDLAFTLHQLGMAEAVTTQYHIKREALRESLDIYTQLNDRFYMAEELTWIGTTVMDMYITRQEIGSSEEYFQQALAILRDIGDQNGLAWVLMHMGYTASWRRDYDEAQRLYEEAIAIQRQRHDLKGLHSSLIMSSQRYLRLGNFQEALRVAEESAEIGSTLSIPAIRQSSMVVLGLLFILLETDVDGGRQLCEEALNMNISHSFSVGDPHFDARQGLFVAAYLNGDYDGMRRQYRAVLDLFPVYNVCIPDDKFVLLAPSGVLMLAHEGQSERAVELLSFILHVPGEPKSRALHWLERLPLIVRLRDELQQQMGTDTFDAAWERGKSLDLTCVVDDLETMLDEPVQPDVPSPAVSAQPDALTERELEVLGLVAEGLSNREIASRLVLALGTVKWYISEVYSKLGVTSRTQAIARARELQLLT
jgi:DNA-binding CsgD family transcriptional regulator/tetratricopeptide (TPR) repeat protein